MTHEHCDKCFLINCPQSSSCCPLIYCLNGCSVRMHECKRYDHENICPNVFIPCLNIQYGCPTTVRRSHLTRHLQICPASVTVCSFTYNHEYQFEKFPDSKTENLIEKIALQDNIWFQHMQEFQRKQEELRSELNYNKAKKNPTENLIRSEKYRYIIMPECMLSRGDGVVCSACRQHLKQLEENEDQRLLELSEEERKQMVEFNLNFDDRSNLTLFPSLLKLSTTLINSIDIPTVSPSPARSTTDLSSNHPLPIITDVELPSSHIYRLNYFSSNPNPQNLSKFNKSPQFSCQALCRRDEIERHWLTHLQVDCILNTSLIQQCPKSEYGCSFQYERLEPCRINGQPIRMRFDQTNDAIAFEWDLTQNEQQDVVVNLLNLPSEILVNILMKLDSLSLRNISLVCQRLRAICQDLLPIRGIVMTEYERHPLPHGDITWRERKKHWLFTNTSSGAPKWQLKTAHKSTSLSQHLSTCPYGETKDLQNEPPFALPSWTNRECTDKSAE